MRNLESRVAKLESQQIAGRACYAAVELEDGTLEPMRPGEVLNRYVMVQPASGLRRLPDGGWRELTAEEWAEEYRPLGRVLESA